MKYLLNSNIIIAAILGSSETLRARLAACDEGDLVTSAIVYAEVAHGSSHGKPPPPLNVLDAALQDIAVLPFDAAAGLAYASLPFVRASYDRLIAAHALSLDLTLVSHNVRHFSDMPGLRVENWLS